MSRSLVSVLITMILLLQPVVSQQPAGAPQPSPKQGDATSASSVYTTPSRNVEVEFADPEDVATTLNAQFEGFKFSASASTNRVYFRASADVAKEVAEFVQQLEEHALGLRRLEQQKAAELAHRKEAEEERRKEAMSSEMVTLNLRYVAASELDRVLEELEMLRESALAIHPDGKSVTLRGTKEQIAPIVALAETLDVPPESPPKRPSSTNPESASGQDPLSRKYGANGIAGDRRYANIEGSTSSAAASESPPTKQALDQLQKQFDDVEARIQRLAKEAAQSNNAKAALKAEIGRSFELRQRLQMAQIAVHRARLDSMWNRIAQRETLSRQIIERRLSELVEREQAAAAAKVATAARELRGDVQIEAVDNDMIIVRGGKDDVKRVVEAIAKIDADAAPRAGSRSAASEDDMLELRTNEYAATLQADSPEHLDKLSELLPKWEYGEVAKSAMRRLPDGKSAVFVGTQTRVGRVSEIFEDVKLAEKLNESLPAAKDVSVRFFGPTGAKLALTFGDQSYSLPAEFRVNSGDLLPLTISNLSTRTGKVDFFAMLQIEQLDEDSRKFFRENRLPLAIAISDADRIQTGKTVIKTYYRQRAGDVDQIRIHSSTDRNEDLETFAGKRVARLSIGNVRPPTSQALVTAQPQVSGIPPSNKDSIVSIEAIIKVSENGSETRKALYTQGLVVGDDGLIALVLDESFMDPDSKSLPKTDSITIKTSRGNVLRNARIVAFDGVSGLVLMQSSSLPVHAFSLNGPTVVASQRVESITAEGHTRLTTVQAANRSAGEQKLFTISGVNYITGAPVLLETTGQLIGVIAGDLRAAGNTWVVPVERIRQVVSEYRQRD